MNSTKEGQTENYVSFNNVMPLVQRGITTNNLLPIINPDAPSWSVVSSLGIWFLSVVLIFLLSGVAIAGYIFSQGVSLADVRIDQDPTAIVVSILAIFPAHLLTLAAAWLLVTQGGERPFLQTLGWQWNSFNFWACLITTIVLYALGIAVVGLLGEPENDFVRVLQSSRAAVYATAVLATFTAPIVEEVVYRGILYPAFFEKYGTAFAILFVTLLFALVHVPQYLDSDKIQNLSSYGSILIICLLSFVLTSIRAWTRSLLPCFVIHTLFNGIQSLLLVASPFLEKSLAPTEHPTGVIYFGF